MFDNVMNAAKGYFPNRLILFFVAGLVAMLLDQLVEGGGIDAMAIVRFAVGAAVAGLLGSLAVGAARD